MRPHKIPFWAFWFGGFTPALRKLRNEIIELYGGWYCHGCKKYHGPRTIQYKKASEPVNVGTICGDVMVRVESHVCSKHVEDSSE